MTRRRIVASYFISLAALWLITCVVGSVWRGSVGDGAGTGRQIAQFVERPFLDLVSEAGAN